MTQLSPQSILAQFDQLAKSSSDDQQHTAITAKQWFDVIDTRLMRTIQHHPLSI